MKITDDDVKLLAEKVLGWEVLGKAPVLYADGATVMESSPQNDYLPKFWVYVDECVCNDSDIKSFADEPRHFGHHWLCLGVVDDPREDDNDLMRLWDKFSEDKDASMEHNYIPNSDDSFWQVQDDYGVGCNIATSSDRREAMLECMLKAVKNNQK